MESKTRKLVITALFTALCCSSAIFTIPLAISPIPITLQNFFVLLTGLLLGPLYGSLAVLIFLALGAIGLPVFSGGSGGLGHFLGATGGYLIGYLFAAFLAGIIFLKRKKILAIIASITGILTIYFFGILRLTFLPNMTISKAISIGIVPFIIPDSIKAILAVLVSLGMVRFIDRILGKKIGNNIRS